MIANIVNENIDDAGIITVNIIDEILMRANIDDVNIDKCRYH